MRKDSSGGTILVSAGSTTSGWQDVASAKATKIVAQVTKNTSSSSYYGTMSVPYIAYDGKGAKREVSVITKAKTLDLRHNWYGTFPAILPHADGAYCRQSFSQLSNSCSASSRSSGSISLIRSSSC